jgi:hypothetical protein
MYLVLEAERVLEVEEGDEMGSMGIGGGSAAGVCVRRAAMAALLASAGGWIWSSAAAQAQACPNEDVRAQEVYASRLPDCRAYEQVSPVDKSATDAAGGVRLVQAAPDGEAVTFWAVSPFAPTMGGAALPTYLGIRSPEGNQWSTQNAEALVHAGAGETVHAVTDDLSKTIVSVGTLQIEPCEPTVEVCAEQLHENVYARNNATGTFQLLARQDASAIGRGEVDFAGATPGGSRILFDSYTQLTPQANPGPNVYEWDEAKPPAERIGLAGVLPDGSAPTEGSWAGPGGPEAFRNLHGALTQHTISEDGSRIFFTDAETGHIYMREPEAEPAATIPISAGQGLWRGATRDGSYVLYTEGSELYRFNVNRFQESKEAEPVALAEAREQLTNEAEGVIDVLGSSEEHGFYVYFTARGELAGNENANNEKAAKGAVNLYEWHEGELTFITTQASVEARVSSTGQYLLFRATAKVTPYDNRGFAEFYRYDAGQPFSSHNPVCVSCNPSGSPAAANAALTSDPEPKLVAKVNPRDPFLTHNLSSDGRRVFFETREALVAGDANLQTDVYEWEANGDGSCEGEAQDGGCLYLISTGQSLSPSYFGDVSTDGNTAFFFTRESLVSQDQDDNIDVYAARVDGGILGQNPRPAPATCAQEPECRGASSNAPSAFGVPTSATLEGPGNVAAQPPPTTIHAKPPTNAQRRANALKACRKKHKHHKRLVCERSARKRFPIKGGKSAKGRP